MTADRRLRMLRNDDARLRRLAAFVTVAALALVGASLPITATQVARGWIPFAEPGVAQTTIAVAIFATAFPLLGWVILRRLPANRLGWIYLTIGFWQALNMFASGYSTLAFWVAGGDLPVASELSWVATWAWVPGFTLFSTLGILLFPNGDLPSRRWWPVLAVTGVALVLLLVPGAVATWPYRGLLLERANALNMPPAPDQGVAMAFAIQAVGQIVLLVAMIGSAGGLAARFRRSAGVERQQLKWFTYAAILDVLVIAVWIANVLDPLAGALSAVVFATILPIAAGIAILRYRLYDIDRVISRTLAYALLTAFLAAVYAAGFLGLEAVLAPFTRSGGPVAVAASTLAVFALFAPVRKRIQATVDRRFNRRRYDAAREVDAFAAQIRDEVEVERLTVALEHTLERTMQPTTASVWLEAGGSSGGGR